MNNFGPVIIGLLLASLGMHVYSLYCLRRISRKMSWWRNKAVKTNGMLRQMTYNVSKLANNKMTEVANNELDANIGKS